MIHKSVLSLDWLDRNDNRHLIHEYTEHTNHYAVVFIRRQYTEKS